MLFITPSPANKLPQKTTEEAIKEQAKDIIGAIIPGYSDLAKYSVSNFGAIVRDALKDFDDGMEQLADIVPKWEPLQIRPELSAILAENDYNYSNIGGNPLVFPNPDGSLSYYYISIYKLSNDTCDFSMVEWVGYEKGFFSKYIALNQMVIKSGINVKIQRTFKD